jgi:hypothetical protein
MAETAHLLKKSADRHIQHISPMKTASRDSGEANESFHFGFTPFSPIQLSASMPIFKG